jgi:hypothetical protein
MGIDPETTGNTASTLGDLESCVRVDVPSPAFDDVSDYNIDVYVKGDTPAPIGYQATVTYDQNVVHIAAPGTDDLIKLPAGVSFSDTLPDSDGTFLATAVYLDPAEFGTPGDGAVARLGLDIGGSGVVTFTLSPNSGYASGAGTHPAALVSAQLAISQDCPGVTPTPSPTPTPMPTPTPTVTSTPPPGTTLLVRGWNNSCYIGPDRPIEDALPDRADHVLAVYRMRADQGFDRWFPNRSDLSTMIAVSGYQPLFILMGEQASWVHEPSGASPTSVPLAGGWSNVCYTDHAKSVEEATAGVAGGFEIMYQLGSDQVWRRFVPGRSDVSNIVQLNEYDCVLILVSQGGGTTWSFDR